MTLFEQAQHYHQTGKLEQAKAIYQELLEEDPKDPVLLHSLAILLSQQGLHKDAIAHIEKAAALSQADFKLYTSLGNIYLRAKLPKKAMDAFNKLLTLKPGYAIAHSNLGNCHLALNQFDQAKSHYQQAIELDNTLVDAKYNYATLMAKQNQFEKAKTLLQSILKHHPNHGPSLAQLAQIAIEEQQDQAALDYLRQHISVNPDHANSLHDLGLLMLKDDQLEAALPLLRRAVELGCSDPNAYFNYATALLANKEDDTALTYYLKQISHQPNWESYYNAGVILMNKQRHRESLDYFQAVLKQQPDNVDTLLNIAGIYLKLNSPGEAIHYYRQAEKLSPNDPEIHHILAALTQSTSPAKAPNSYAKHLFDQYAPHYEKHLTEYLRYQAPEKLRTTFDLENAEDRTSLTIIDLGCGTGLMGAAFQDLANRLIGIDISKPMLEQAQAKGIYQQLLEGDIIETLPSTEKADLIIAAELFNYFGDLKNLINMIANQLKTKGQLLFTIETGHQYPYHLNQSIRYNHHPDYIKELLTEKFTIQRFDNIVLRKQQQDDVEGHVILAEVKG